MGELLSQRGDELSSLREGEDVLTQRARELSSLNTSALSERPVVFVGQALSESRELVSLREGAENAAQKKTGSRAPVSPTPHFLSTTRPAPTAVTIASAVRVAVHVAGLAVFPRALHCNVSGRIVVRILVSYMSASCTVFQYLSADMHLGGILCWALVQIGPRRPSALVANSGHKCREDFSWLHFTFLGAGLLSQPHFLSLYVFPIVT